MTMRYKLATLLVVATFIPLLAFVWGGYWYAKRELTRFILDRVTNVNTLKAAVVTEFFSDRLQDARDVQRLGVFSETVPTLSRLIQNTSDPAFGAATRTLDSQLADFRTVHDFEDIKVVGPGGRLLYVANPDTGTRPGDLVTETMLQAFESGQKGLFVSDVFAHEKPTRHFSILFSVPLADAAGLQLGVVLLEAELDGVYQEIADVTGLSNTGETYLGKDDGFSVLMLTSLRSDSAAALQRRVNYGERNGQAIQQATRGKSGAGTVIDYSGTEVLAAWRFLPEANWGIVTKIEATEALQSVSRLRSVLLVASPVMGLGMILLILIVTNRWLARPLQRLSTAAEHIARGDYDVALDHSLLYGQGDLARLATHLHNIANRFRYHYERRHYSPDDEANDQEQRRP